MPYAPFAENAQAEEMRYARYLFELAQQYERGSLLITSNLPFSKWDIIFKDPMTTAAAIDRLVHHSVVLELNVSSYRVEEAQKRRNIDP